MTAVVGWENFYVIVGSSAGALIGLQFVVMTLLADMPLREGSETAGSAFGTPTVIHFGAVLLLAGLLTAPWEGIAPIAVLWGIVGFSGLVYMAITTRRMRSQTAYRPEFEDWLFHSLLPFVAYGILSAAAFAVSVHVRGSLFAVGAAALLLLFIGIHNAWDAVTYHVFVQRKKTRETGPGNKG
jgi:hypothetical protein